MNCEKESWDALLPPARGYKHLGEHGEDFDRIHAMERRVSKMTDDELTEAWNAMRDYNKSKYYDKGIPHHEWIISIFGERLIREKKRQEELKFAMLERDLIQEREGDM